jgi:hypothetical protein
VSGEILRAMQFARLDMTEGRRLFESGASGEGGGGGAVGLQPGPQNRNLKHPDFIDIYRYQKFYVFSASA